MPQTPDDAALGPRGPSARVTPLDFGRLPDGRPVRAFDLEAGGLRARVAAWGATLVALHAPDRVGRLDDVVLGHDDVAGYVGDSQYVGAVAGRYANRIAGGRFTLDGVAHQVTVNNGPNHLHGGRAGFDQRLWTAEPFARGDAAGVTLRYESADGEEGYPGTLTAEVTYRLGPWARLTVSYRATTDRATPVNLTQHAYWNLAGARSATVLDHRLRVRASRYTPTDETQIPVGPFAPVQGTPFDFRALAPIGLRIDAAHPQLATAGGYDHNFVLDDAPGPDGLRHAARVEEPLTGRTLDVRTTEPGLQVYSGNYLDGSMIGKAGRPLVHRGGLCLETQHFPDSPNHPEWPSTILRPGEEYRSRTEFVLGIG